MDIEKGLIYMENLLIYELGKVVGSLNVSNLIKISNS